MREVNKRRSGLLTRAKTQENIVLLDKIQKHLSVSVKEVIKRKAARRIPKWHFY